MVSRLVVLDKDRVLRNQLEDLATLSIYGTNVSGVVRILVARTHARHFERSTTGASVAGLSDVSDDPEIPRNETDS